MTYPAAQMWAVDQSESMSKQYKVSELSAATGVPSATLRLWEQHGLLVPARTPSGYRLYSESDFARVHQIVRLRSVQGLNLAAIKTSLDALSGEHEATADEPASRLGQEIRRLRTQRKMTISALASKVSVSASVLSTLERTSRGASVPLLRAIAEALGVTVTQLTASPVEIVKAVVRSGEGRQEWTLVPGAGSEGFYRHEGEEFIRVLEGTFEIEVEGLGLAVLQQNDSIYFESHRAHSWQSLGDRPCRLLWVNTPPTF